MLKKLLCAGAAILLFAAAKPCLGAGPAVTKMLARLPAPVQQTIHAQVGDGTLESIDKTEEDGELSYDVEMTRDGKVRDFSVNAKGQLTQMQLFLAELSSALKKAIQAQVGKGTLGDIYRSIDDGAISYDVDVALDGKTHTYTFADDGRLLLVEMDLAALPPAIQATIQKQTAGATLGEIDKSLEDTDVKYDVDMTRDGKSRTFTVGEKGELLDEEVFLSELPAALQTAIQKEVGTGKLKEITRSNDAGEISYDAEISSGATTRTVTFAPDGTIQSQEQPVKLAEVPEAVRKTVQTLGGKILQVSKVSEDGEISYDVDLVVSDKPKTVSVSPDGKILPDDN